ncbi:hypothetical protein [Caldibacillus debilis]|uniref:Uncharacterized protein n=1 Tax=Caldibacillus debilis GB1 TaxID=1339248 RepID=A0A420VEL7_9BACI|nr:hypothetical protein [Caldibacillus debilis]RKO61813.1 hypothetical protein Cdeb_01308 [Caldibacillus debilis GB1]
MNLVFRNKVLIANKWLVLLSGLNKNPVVINGIRDTEKHYFRIPDDWAETRWTKSLIKQVLAYLGLTNSEGDLGIVDLEELADVLCCSLRTVRNNNKTLEKLNLVQVEPLYGNLARIRLLDYKANFLDLRDSGGKSTGYTSIQREALFDLLDISKVGVLRIACRALYLHEREVHLEGNPAALLTAKDFKGFLPKYFSFRPVIERAIHSLWKLFDKIEVLDTRGKKSEILANYKQSASLMEKLKSSYMFAFRLHPTKDSRAMDVEEEKTASLSITYGLFELHKKFGVERVEYNTALELTRDYGRVPVQQAVEEISHYWQDRHDKVSETLYKVIDAVKDLRFTDRPVGALRKIFKEYSRAYQEGFFAQI